MPVALPSSTAVRQRVIRVFVSSTFRDMQQEREELVKRAFPQLRKLCEERDVLFADVDLRWGITDEQEAEGQVLPICLAEIQRCRPYFIGLIGQRYGSTPEAIPADLVAQEPWLAEHRERSVTELEILHGVLNNPAMAQHAFFYFRSRAFLETVAPDKRDDYTETPRPKEVVEYGAAEGARRAAARAQKLETLKARIRRSGFPVYENYPDPVSLGELVTADLTRAINERFPAGTRSNPLQRARAEHEVFARNRAAIYVARDRDLARLDAHVSSDGPPLVVTGASGIGKSALLSEWILRQHGDDPVSSPKRPRFRWFARTSSTRDAKKTEPTVIAHFVGAGGDSADLAGLLRRCIEELKDRLRLSGVVPDDPRELGTTFARFLVRAAKRGRIVLILDGIDQLEDRGGALDLTWLPEHIPATIRLIVSTSSGRPLEILGRRPWPTLKVEPLDSSERISLTKQYLLQYSKTLPRSELRRIAEASQTGSPLFLRLLLEELRVSGDHQTLGHELTGYLAAATPDALFDLILARYERDYERGRPGLVRDAMSIVWAARRGLSEGELLDMLGRSGARPADLEPEPLPHAIWSPLYLAAEHTFLQHSGRLTFAHEYLRRAVARRYLSFAGEAATAHLRIADYFEPRDVGLRVIAETPWQLAQAQAWDRLAALLASPRFLEPAWAASRWDIRTYWTELEANSPHRMVDVYRAVIEGPIDSHVHAWNVGLLLQGAGEVAAAVHLQKQLIDHFRSTGNVDLLTGALGNTASLLVDRGAYRDALELLEEEEQLARRSKNKGLVAHALSNRAKILTSSGDRRAAAGLLDEAIALARDAGERRYLAFFLGNRAAILADEGELQRALEMFREQERISREFEEPEGLALALENQARAFKLLGDLDAALARLAELEAICRPIGMLELTTRALAMRVEIARTRGEISGALALLDEESTIHNQLGDGAGVLRCVLLQASILRDGGQHEAAVERCRAAERVARELTDSNCLEAALIGLQMCVGSLAIMRKREGRIDEACTLLNEQEKICREIGYKDGLQASLGDQANILHQKGDLVGSLRLHDEEERLCRELGDRDALQGALGNRGGVLMTMGQDQEALKLFREKERLCREIGNAAGLATALANQAAVLSGPLHRPADALPLAEEAARTAEEANLGPRALQMRAMVLMLRGIVGA